MVMTGCLAYCRMTQPEGYEWQTQRETGRKPFKDESVLRSERGEEMVRYLYRPLPAPPSRTPSTQRR